MLHNNIIAFIVTFLLSVIWLRFVGFAASRGWIGANISRKVIHIGTGPLFVICWLLFDEQPGARYLAVIVPLASTLQFALAGLGLIRDKQSVQSMSRTGYKEELLKGPLFYGLAFIVITLIYWKTSPIGMTALMILCGGDGLADIFGKKFGKRKVFWSKEKTWFGSLAMLFGGFTLSLAITALFDYSGVYNIQFAMFIPKLIIISLVSTLIESMSKSDLDNITVPIAAVLIGILVNL